MLQPRHLVTALLAVLILGGCSAATRSGSTSPALTGDILYREAILESGRSNAYDALEYLRPLWLRERSDQSANRRGGIVVYVDETRFGGLEALRTVAAREIYQIQRYNTTAASQRWGPGHSEGVLVVSTRPVNEPQ